jgi:DNA-binding protein Fis
MAQRVMIVFAMQACSGNKTHAAKWLGISVRAIRYKIKRFEIRREEWIT